MRDFSFDLVLEFSVWSVIVLYCTVLYCANIKILWDALFNMLHSFHSLYLLSLLASSGILVSPWPDSNTTPKLFRFDEYSVNLYGSSWFSISFCRARCVVLSLMRVLVLKHTAIPFMQCIRCFRLWTRILAVYTFGVVVWASYFFLVAASNVSVLLCFNFFLENDKKLAFFCRCHNFIQ